MFLKPQANNRKRSSLPSPIQALASWPEWPHRRPTGTPEGLDLRCEAKQKSLFVKTITMTVFSHYKFHSVSNQSSGCFTVQPCTQERKHSLACSIPRCALSNSSSSSLIFHVAGTGQLVVTTHPHLLLSPGPEPLWPSPVKVNPLNGV